MFDEILTGLYTISVNDVEGYKNYEGSKLFSVEQTTHTIVLKEEAVATFDVPVTIYNQGTGINGVAIKITNRTTGDTYSGTTGTLGSCTLSNVKSGLYDVVAEKTGYNIYSSQKDLNVDLHELSFAMTNNALRNPLITVLTTDDEPIEDATIVINNAVNEYQGTTTNRGQLTFTDLLKDTYTVTVNADGYNEKILTVTFNDSHRTETIKLDKNGDKFTATIYATNSNGGKLKEATVIVGDTSYTTDTEGKIRISDFTAGEVTVKASKTGYATVDTTYTFTAENPIYNAVLEADTKFTLEFEVGNGRIGGHVYDAEVIIGENTYSSGSTGKFEVENFEEGYYDITINADGFYTYTEQNKYINSVGREVFCDMSQKLTTRALFTVQDVLGNLLGNIPVKLVNQETGVELVAKTKTEGVDKGKILFNNIYPGTYWLECVDDTEPTHIYNPWQQDIEITSEGHDSYIELEFHSPAIYGYVSCDEGTFYNDSEVTITATNITTGETQTQHTDEMGRYFFVALGTGTWSIKVTRTNYYSSSAKQFRLVSQNERYDILLQPSHTFNVKGPLVSEDNIPLSDYMIWFNNHMVTTDENGEYELTDLMDYNYAVFCNETDPLQRLSTNCVINQEDTVFRGKIPYIRTSLTGMVYLETEGTPASNAVIQLGGESYTCDENGKYYIENVLKKSRPHTATIEYEGYKTLTYDFIAGDETSWFPILEPEP